MYVVAHEDDTLLFQSPTLLLDLRSEANCVRTVFVTAGDAGLPESYWRGREEGAEAGYAEMLGVGDAWTTSTLELAGHAIRLRTSVADPRVSLVFMRLPDGEVTGEGTPRYGMQSLLKLWNGGHGLTPAISTMTADDGSASYTYAGLLETLGALMGEFQPTQIATQNYAEAFFEHGDHPDHAVTADLVKLAASSYGVSHRLRAYQGYDVSSKPANVTGSLLAAKRAAFFAYGEHDAEVCDSQPECEESFYGEWLPRQYVTATETSGVVAAAGFGRTATATEAVTLNGSESSDESGAPLIYEWRQTLGPAVQVSGANTATPSFTVPDHPTLLTFALTVRDGVLVSPVDSVDVRVPGEGTAPMAVAGPAQTVAAAGAVELDGSESWGPNSETLKYIWTQTGGPTVTLAEADGPRPTFVAPAGPATLTFALTVSNETQTSTAASVTVTVEAPPPTPPPPADPGTAGTSPARTPEATGTAPVIDAPAVSYGFGGAAFRLPISASGDPAPSFSLAGDVPVGLRLVATGPGQAALVGRPEGVGTRRLTVVAASAQGTDAHQVKLVLERRPTLGRSVVRLAAGDRVRTVVGVQAMEGAKVSVAGAPPTGIVLRASGRRLLIAGTPEATRATVYRLSVSVGTRAGAARLPLRLVVAP